ncbi:MAG: type-F conjugative transfer system secretin TraK [Candidatus Tectomicrobia bacterium]|nr:type-F conjugative transfer system secretin TraK [Candidatus Tectomicrobia bacterium]
MRRPWLLVTALGVAWASVALAGVRLVQVGSEPVPVYVEAGVPVAVTFPERIEAIPTGADPATLSLEIEGNRLFIQSLVEGFEARLFVIAAGGRMYRLHLTEREGEPDDRVQLVLPAPPPAFGAETPAEQRPPAGRRGRKRESPLRRLLTAMMEGTKLPGVSVADHAQTLFDDGVVAICTLRVYVAGRYLGYVALAENRGTEPVALRLPEYRAAGLRAIAAERETLAPDETTRVYLVVEAAKGRN